MAESTGLQGRFAEAAKRQWQQLADELRADLRAYGERSETADFEQSHGLYRIANPESGLAVALHPDFDAHTIRYTFENLGHARGGAPEGGVIAMRPSPTGAVEFYSADQQLTAEQARHVLLDPLFVEGAEAA